MKKRGTGEKTAKGEGRRVKGEVRRGWEKRRENGTGEKVEGRTHTKKFAQYGPYKTGSNSFQ
jgi:hypothetical protein